MGILVWYSNIIILEINKYTKKKLFSCKFFFLNVIHISVLCVIIGNII